MSSFAQAQTVVEEVCNDHPGKICDMFCRDCNCPVCITCMTTKHLQHGFGLLNEEIEIRKGELKNLANETEQRELETFEKYSDDVKKLREKYKKGNAECRSNIQLQLKLLHNTVDEIIDGNIEKLQCKEKQDLESMDQREQALMWKIDEYKSVIETARRQLDSLGKSNFIKLRDLNNKLFAYTGRSSECGFDVPAPPSFESKKPNIGVLEHFFGDLKILEDEYEFVDKNTD